MGYPKPHTKKWFEELKKINPQYAMGAEQMVSVSHTTDCCTFCGDTSEESEIQDYELIQDKNNPVGFSFRMCPDCVSIRETQDSQKFIPIKI